MESFFRRLLWSKKTATPVAALSPLGHKPRTRPTAPTPNASASVAAAGSSRSGRAIPITATTTSATAGLGLQQLIKDVEAGVADFQIILVYDVSRWGRFQDADESAYYEYICRRAGIQVAYCAEQFENDGSPVSTIVKGVKRAMAGEYSRELSAKVI